MFHEYFMPDIMTQSWPELSSKESTEDIPDTILQLRGTTESMLFMKTPAPVQWKKAGNCWKLK